LEIQIEDNGVGAVAAPNGAGGQGLALHTALLAVVGATLALESQPGVYTRVAVHLPRAGSVET
jgi:signal transduction histidine kinase